MLFQDCNRVMWVLTCRWTYERTGHLTVLFALGRTLLDYDVLRLGIEEMRSLFDYENGKLTDRSERELLRKRSSY
jgi:hypothetical protein